MRKTREFDVKIKRLGSTRKIARTMKLISASKLRKAHEAQANAKLYARHLTELTSRICASVDPAAHLFLTARDCVRKALILIITSDKGLCGAFNHNANRQVDSWIRENRHLYDQIDLLCCGKKGFAYFVKHDIVKFHYENVTASPRFADAMRIGYDLGRAFFAGDCDEVYLSYNRFFNPLLQKTIFEKVLPVDPHALTDRGALRNAEHSQDLVPEISSKFQGGQKPAEYIFEPQAAELLKFLIPHFLYFKIYFALLENSAGEHAARMTAMDSAASNAQEMIDRYTLQRNRARQAAITTELAEIISGSEALHHR